MSIFRRFFMIVLIFIVWPGIHLSTEAVYRKVRLNLTKIFSNVNMLQYAIKRGDAFLIEKNAFNALERSACSLCEDLEKIKRRFDKEGMLLKVTGSGSALYTIAQSSAKVKRILWKKWLGFAVQTF